MRRNGGRLVPLAYKIDVFFCLFCLITMEISKGASRDCTRRSLQDPISKHDYERADGLGPNELLFKFHVFLINNYLVLISCECVLWFYILIHILRNGKTSEVPKAPAGPKN